MKRTNTLKGTFLRNMLLVSLATLTAWTLLLIWGDMAAFQRESEAARQAYLDDQKEDLRSQVGRLEEYIQYMIGTTRDRLRSQIRDRVNEAVNIAQNIWEQNRDKKSPEEIGRMITDALRPIRFNHGRGYYFAFDRQATEVLFADRPEMEGRNMMSVRGAQDEWVVRDMLDLTENNPEGFYEYTWWKPGETDKGYPKIAFVKRFDPLGWVIGTGEYLDSVRDNIQEEVLARAVGMRFGKEGYFFGSTLTGEPLFSNGRITRGTANINGLTDPDGVKIIRRQQEEVKKYGHGFVSYSWPKLHDAAPAPKLSYVTGIPEWGWIVGAGVYVDAIETEQAAKKRALYENLKHTIQRSLLLLLLFFLVAILWSRHISGRIEASIRDMVSFFRRSATQAAPLDTESLNYREFIEIAEAAGRMIADREAAQAALKNSENRYRTVVDTLAEGVILQAAGGEILAWNRAAEAILGVHEKERLEHASLDRDWPTVREDGSPLPGEEHPSIITLKTGRPCFGVVMGIKREDRGLGWISVNTSPVFGEDPKIPEGVVISLTDISDKKKADEEREVLATQLRQAQKMESIGTLAGGIAHDFNNILSIIMGNAELAHGDMPAKDPARENLSEILTAAKRGKEVVSQLLSFARKEEEEAGPVDAVRLVRESISLIRATLPANIEIRTRFKDEASVILAEPARIQQVLINLYTNAAHAMPGGGTLEVEVENIQALDSQKAKSLGLSDGPHVMIRVRDTGDGMEPATLERVFDPYFTTKEVGKGSGLGLSVAHGIVQAHGGGIFTESTPGRGSTFEILLPLAGGEIPGEEAPAGEFPGGTERVLFLDDEPSIVRLGRSLLERLGYRVTAYTNSRGALETFQARPFDFDLVITDMAMPGMTGDVLAKEILKIRPEIPIILCTGYSDRVSDSREGDGGIAAFVSKPFVTSEIAAAIRRVLD